MQECNPTAAIAQANQLNMKTTDYKVQSDRHFQNMFPNLFLAFVAFI